MKNIISQVLLESLYLYQCFVLITVDKQTDRSDIFNALRAIPNVVIVKPKDSDFLNAKETEDTGYSYVNIKFISNRNAVSDFKKIRQYALMGGMGTSRVIGLKALKFNPSKIYKID